MTQLTINVPEIHCDHCKESLEAAVGTLDGVVSAEVAIDAHTIDVTYDENVTPYSDIVTAIEDQGYEVP
ncbi:MAG: cation transporter [Acidimicrobiia bacterium]